MALVATYGNVSAFNIKVYDMAGGGYYAVLNDGATAVFQRRNAADGNDTHVYVSGNASKLDRFLSYAYDAATSTLTFSGSVDTFEGVTFTRSESYKFVSDYVVENIWICSVNTTGGKINFTNWNYYPTADKIWEIDSTDAGDFTSVMPLGIGVQLTAGGSVYGSIADNSYNNRNCVKKRALASVSGIACTWIAPDDGQLSLVPSAPLSIKQWFFKSANTLRDFNLQSQLAVAAGKGYTGTTFDKICKVTAYINVALNSDLTTVKMMPSFYYGHAFLQAMWMRDSFWQSFYVDSAIEQGAITRFEIKQNESGQIPTYINESGTGTFNHDECTCLYLIRAYYDQTMRGLAVNSTSLQNALNYIRTQVTSDEFRFNASNYQSWLDSYNYTNGTYSEYVQGVYCVALKCAKALGLSVTDTEINNAATKYTALYDTTNKYIKFTSNSTHMSTSALVGEALNIFLFNQKFFTDEQVKNHTARLRGLATTVGGLKCVCASDGSYLSTGAFIDSSAQGDYQNGGSWLLYEYLTYYAGYYHNVQDARAMMDNRNTQELSISPIQKEYMVSKVGVGNYLDEPASRHVYAWNVFTSFSRPTGRQPVY